jgi:hypothetical protein
MENLASLEFLVGMLYAINVYAQICKLIEYAVDKKHIQGHTNNLE